MLRASGSVTPKTGIRSRAQGALANIALLSLGSLICALAINGILAPCKFASGGLVGAALIINGLCPELKTGALLALMNLPLFILAWWCVGRVFFVYSLLGAVLFILAVDYVQAPMPAMPSICAVFVAGLLSGIGGGCILRSAGSAGGVDVLSVMLKNRFGISLGTTSLVINVLVLSGAALTLPLGKTLYTLLFFFVTAQTLDLAVMGKQSPLVLRLSSLWAIIRAKAVSAPLPSPSGPPVVQ